ncbi:MAG: hypothetical protein U9Q30_03060 [Campylobacterota bacterium]|nr:hypothetical protein [Campylobacterota bacterium]
MGFTYPIAKARGFTLLLGKAVVKQTPKAITTVAKVKREISDGVVNTYNELEKERLENEFEEKIKQLKRR